MEIYGTLKKDHKLFKAILKKIDKTTEKKPERRQKLLDQLKFELVVHSRAEEKTLYDPLKKSEIKKADELAFEGYEEHAMVDHLFAELAQTKANDKRWTALASVLKELLEHHIEEEEEDVFKKSHKSFARAVAKEMAVKFLDLKKTYKAELKKGKKLAQPRSHELVK